VYSQYILNKHNMKLKKSANYLMAAATLTGIGIGAIYTHNHSKKTPQTTTQIIQITNIRISDKIKQRTLESLELLAFDTPNIPCAPSTSCQPSKISDSIMKAILKATYHIDSDRNSIIIGNKDNGCEIKSFGNYFQTKAELKEENLTFTTALKDDENLILKTCTLNKNGKAI